MTAIRIVVGYLLAVVATTAFAAAFHTHMVVAGLKKSGAAIPVNAQLGMTASDLAGLAPQYGMVIGIALLVGFLIAALLRRVLKPLALIAYPLAGAAAIAVALTAMGMAFDGITPIAGARSALGLALQCLAGAIGGLIFSMIAVRKG